MSMVHVGIVWMRVDQAVMNMLMGVGLSPIPGEVVSMSMMLVMVMRVRVRLRLVCVQVHVALGNMQPHACSHENTRRQ
jgi:hypothetical protein